MNRAALLLLMVLAGAAQAQPAPPTESVTVTGARSRQVLDQFVQSFAAPTRMTGKLARWEDGVCPVTVGLKPAFTKFISVHVKDVASQVGAPVNAQSGCKPNIEIVFTTAPQKLLDNIRKKQATYLGYADNSAQMDALAKVSHPIQAWYTTATRDLRGETHVDSSKVAMSGIPIEVPCPDCPDGKIRLYGISAGTVTGSRLGDGMRSSLYHVIIVADPTKLADYEIGTLADYVAMLSLAQLSSLDLCQTLPSIVNTLAKNCAMPATALAANDLGYLRGLYAMGPGRNLRGQEDAIAFQMQQQQDGK
jgi:hypothetical protein